MVLALALISLVSFAGLPVHTSQPIDAKDWRTLVPLHATRIEVRKVLGPCDTVYDVPQDEYHLKDGHLWVIYSWEPCGPGLPKQWGKWNAPKDTLLAFEFRPWEPVPLDDLRIPDIASLKFYTDPSGATYYRDGVSGITYEVNTDRKVTWILYGPRDDDVALRCS